MAPDTTTSDAELFAQLAGGREAAESLFRRYSPMAYGLALDATGDASAAEDVVQEAFLNLLRRPPEATAGSMRSYVASVVLNAARSRFRSEKRRQVREERVAVERPARGAALDETAETHEASRALCVALAGLPGEVRTPVLLHVVHEFSQREVARTLGLPHSTVSKRIKNGLDRMRAALRRAGFASMAGAGLLAALRGTGAVSVPSSLAASLTSLAAKAVAGKTGAAGATGSAVLKGGIAMKLVAGVVAASVVAGAVAVSTGVGRGEAPAVGDGKPAPVNPHKGMQDREEVYEFTQKPSVKKEGDKWIITFASKGKCDATVSILDKDGRVVRHLASGVLGSNAPHPFQQNSLSQKLEWDGLTDDFKIAPPGCTVRVSLGLKIEFDRNVLFDPYDVQGLPISGTSRNPKCYVAIGKDGTRYVGAGPGFYLTGRAFDKNGKYLHTFFPPRASDAKEVMGKLHYKIVKDAWGESVVVSTGGYGPFTGYAGGNPNLPKIHPSKFPLESKLHDIIAAVKAQPGAGEVKLVEISSLGLRAPAKLGTQTADSYVDWQTPLMAADRARDEIYVVGRPCGRFDGKTGKRDTTWFPNDDLRGVGDIDVGPDGLVYMRTGPFHYGHWLFRVTHEGKPVLFKHNAENVEAAAAKSKAEGGRVAGPPAAFKGKGLTAIYTGVAEAHSRVHEKGLDVACDGTILTVIEPVPNQKKSGEFMKKHGLAYPDGKLYPRAYYVVAWDRDGRVFSTNAIRQTGPDSQGIHMDRDGNIYRAERGMVPAALGPKVDGFLHKMATREPVASLVKYRGRGGAYPVGVIPVIAPEQRCGPRDLPQVPGLAGSVEMVNYKGSKGMALGALWAYGGLFNTYSCTCSYTRYDLDGWARLWIPRPRLYSVMVLDSGGNRIMRIGRYGNVDDADEKYAKIHMAWPRLTAASDEALYVMDHGNRRVFRCKLGYHAEEALPLP